MYLLRHKGLGRRLGTVAVLMAVTMVVLISIVAISLDGGTLLAERRRAQSTADAAALAAACELYKNAWSVSVLNFDPNGTAKQSALDTAKANGYANDGTTSTVTVNIPPQSGPYIGMTGYAEVIVEYHVTRSFSNIFASGPITVRARAVALGAPIAADVGILVLDPTGKGSFNANGSGGATVTGTPIIVDSSDPSAAIAGGGGTVTAPEIDITGGYSTSGGGSFSGEINLGRRPVSDPLVDLPVPDPTTMTQQSRKASQYTSGTINLQPGVYKGGISASGTASINLAPGIYYMDGGGFSFSGQGSLTGNGVMIYNAPGNGNSAGISVNGQGSVQLSGMTSGIFQGMTFFQDRTSNVTGNISGTSGTTSITGTFYFAGALLNITGNGGVVNLGSQYISNDLNLGGNGNININWTPNTVARKRSIYLVE
jgi:Flp pilus assembly protein TadG